MYPIEKGIPIPPMAYAGNKKKGYPWRELEVGDSFLIQGSNVQNVCRMIHLQQKTHRPKYCARTVEGGIRVWRTE